MLVSIENVHCVVSPDDIVSPNRKTIAELTREFEGKVYGLCCEGCVTIWDQFTDEERAKAVARAMAREPEL